MPLRSLPKDIPRKLTINNLSLQVHLGCTAEERKVAQEVQVTIAITFSHPPLGEVTDLLQDTLCYAEICENIKQCAAKGEYNLVEKLAADFYAVLKERWPDYLFWLQVRKMRPPIEDLLQGVDYFCGDGPA